MAFERHRHAICPALPRPSVDRDTLVRSIRAVYLTIEQLQLPFLAAAIAYYAFVSVLPLLIVTLTVTFTLTGETLVDRILEVAGGVLTPDAAAVLGQALRNSAGREGLTLIGLLVLLWTGLRVFRGLDIAFSRIYGFETPKPLLYQVRDASITLSAITLAIAATALASAVIPARLVPFSGVAGTLAMVVVLPFVFFPLYYVLPNCPLSVREALPGAVVAGFGWTALGTGFGLYAEFTSVQVYGLLGGVLLLVIWFYFAGLIVLLGATVNAHYGGYVEDRQLQQGALREDR